MSEKLSPLTLPRWSRLAAIAAFAIVVAAVAAIALSGGGDGRGHAIVRARDRAPGTAHATHRATLVAEAPDPLAAQSYPEPARAAARHARAAAPRVAAARAVTRSPATQRPGTQDAVTQSGGAPSLSQVEAQLKEERSLEAQLRSHSTASLVDPISGAFTPRNVVPRQIAQVVAAGNAIADFPYVYGGGHASFVDRAYDCSGSVSYALAAASLIGAPETSGQLESWGVPGPGRWLTIFANAGHTFMIVDGVWFDTAGRAGPYSTRWLTHRPSLVGYAVRHYPGL